MLCAPQPPFLHAAKAILIHPKAWKAVFYELRIDGVLGSSHSPSPTPISLSDAFPHAWRIILRLVTDLETDYLPIYILRDL